MSADADDAPQLIDVWGYIKELWIHRLVWFVVFVAVLLGGAAYAFTRPASYQVSQAVILEFPPVATDADAIQQSAFLPATAGVLSRLVLVPPVSDSVLAGHPEISGLTDLQSRISVIPYGNTLLELITSGGDVEGQTKLVQDVARSLGEQLPNLTKEYPPSLRFVARLSGEPAVVQGSSGRTVLLVGSAALAALAATVVTTLWMRRRH